MKKTGKIEVVCGPMFSGKSEELMRRLNRTRIAKRKFQLFKPEIDDRYSEDEVVSHAGQKMKCTPVKFARNVLDLVDEDTEVVAIAVCEVCGDDATHTYRTSETSGTVLVGEHDHYMATCRDHWGPAQ